MQKRLHLIRRDALTSVSQAATNIGFTKEAFERALFIAARSLGLVKRR